MSILSKNRYHRETWRLAWPLILTNISVPLLGVIDTAILGHLDSPLYLGAVAIGTSIITFIFWAFGFLRMGTTSLVARAFGRGDTSGSATLLLQSAILALILAVILLFAQGLFIPLALKLIGASNAVAALADSYCHIRIYSAPATLMTFALIGWFIGQQNTQAPLIVVISQNILNILLDFIFIVGLEMNSDGAAIATVVAEYAGFLLAIGLAWKTIKPELPKINTRQLYHYHHYIELLNINRHLFIRTASLLFTFAFFTAQGARQGDTILAANALLFQLLLLISYGLDGFAHAAEAMVGKAIGAKSQRDFVATCKSTSLWALITALLFSAFFFILQGQLLAFFTNMEDVIAIAENYYLCIIILPILGVWGYQLDGIFIGAGKTRAMQYTMLLSVFAVFIPIWWIFQSYGNWGLWLAFCAFMLSRGLLLGAVFSYFQRHKLWISAQSDTI